MAKETMHNGYKITVEVEEKAGKWYGHYTIQLDGDLIHSDNHVYVEGPEATAENQTLLFAQTYADRHHQGKSPR